MKIHFSRCCRWYVDQPPQPFFSNLFELSNSRILNTEGDNNVMLCKCHVNCLLIWVTTLTIWHLQDTMTPWHHRDTVTLWHHRVYLLKKDNYLSQGSKTKCCNYLPQNKRAQEICIVLGLVYIILIIYFNQSILYTKPSILHKINFLVFYKIIFSA